jgi:hypothetical protein
MQNRPAADDLNLTSYKEMEDFLNDWTKSHDATEDEHDKVLDSQAIQEARNSTSYGYLKLRSRQGASSADKALLSGRGAETHNHLLANRQVLLR